MPITKVTIGTHSGTFHTDEVVAVMIIRLSEKNKDAVIMRTRDINKLNKCDIVVDVGGIFDPNILRFDHHQKGCIESWFKPSLWDWFYPRVMLSSAGMVWRHFGQDIIKELFPVLNDTQVLCVWKKVYTSWIMEIDKQDTTGKKWNGPSLMRTISTLNPLDGATDDDRDTAFLKAVELARMMFYPYLTSLVEAEKNKEKSILIVKSATIFSNGDIMELPSKCISSLFKLIPRGKLPLYLISPDSNGTWMVYAVPIKPDSHISRLPLPLLWRGLRNQELSDKSGINNCVFVHLSGFIGGHLNREGAIKMAETAITMCPWWKRLLIRYFY
jgi:uncharacterized UPF0160 family protein